MSVTARQLPKGILIKWTRYILKSIVSLWKQANQHAVCLLHRLQSSSRVHQNQSIFRCGLMCTNLALNFLNSETVCNENLSKKYEFPGWQPTVSHRLPELTQGNYQTVVIKFSDKLPCDTFAVFHPFSITKAEYVI